MKTTAEQM